MTYGTFDIYCGRIALQLSSRWPETTWYWAQLLPGVLALTPSVWPNRHTSIGPADCILDGRLQRTFYDQMLPNADNPWLTIGEPIDQHTLRRIGRVRFGRIACLHMNGGMLLSDGGDMDFGDADDLEPEHFDWGFSNYEIARRRPI